jgi:pimeloyl-ACP methyl ester carboxylesterase
VIDAEELQAAVLVGHSYGGMVITGVADRLQDPAVLSCLVYLDAVVPESGECWSSTHAEDTRAARRASIARDGCLPPPDPSVYGLEGADHAWVARRQTAHPGGVYDDPLPFDAARVARWPRLFIDCNAPAMPTIAVARQRVRAAPGWTVHTLATGHDAMVSAPEALVECLVAAPRP